MASHTIRIVARFVATTTLIVVALALTATFTHESIALATAPTAQAEVTRCFEDQPCWDSRTMGNGQAGVGDPYGPVMDAGGVYMCGNYPAAYNELDKPICQYV